jgi:hypothetical protein
MGFYAHMPKGVGTNRHKGMAYWPKGIKGVAHGHKSGGKFTNQAKSAYTPGRYPYVYPDTLRYIHTNRHKPMRD